ncbi:glycosyltransferase family 2 protein [Candidatus Woesearchaeota archaeon]|nr:glycosyltransferase family 2 protein [Candidatus Woesearchaeota archaeon]
MVKYINWYECRSIMLVSIIVPAYNEEKRINGFLPSLLSFSKKHLRNCEIIIVDDGSTDSTKSVVQQLIQQYPSAKLISYPENKGKGNAVREGVSASKGKYVLFIDADGSIPPEEIPNMVQKLKEHQVVVGSRRIDVSKVKTSPLRKFTGVMFNAYVNLLFRIDIYDNLCGFKGFEKSIAKALFSDLQSMRWIFDVELFYKIKKNNYTLYHLPISWEHRDGSKIRLIDPLKMAIELLKLRCSLRNYQPKASLPLGQQTQQQNELDGTSSNPDDLNQFKSR